MTTKITNFQRAQKITDKAREYADFIHATNGTTFIKIYITYSRGGQSASGAILARNSLGSYYDTATARGCGYSKKDSILDDLLTALEEQEAFNNDLPEFPRSERGNGDELGKLIRAGYTIIEM